MYDWIGYANKYSVYMSFAYKAGTSYCLTHFSYPSTGESISPQDPFCYVLCAGSPTEDEDPLPVGERLMTALVELLVDVPVL